MDQSTKFASGGLLIVAGHAIYQNGKWYGGFPGEDSFYEQHARDGFGVFRNEKYEALVFSGGHTRPKLQEVQNGIVTNSEGEGILEFALSSNLCAKDEGGIHTESYARDSFENVFFSMLCFYRHYGKWPSRVGIVSWKFKSLRFYLIACWLKLGDGKFIFYGSGDPDIQKTIEIVSSANAKYDSSIVWVKEEPVIMDPLHRDPTEFNKKRLGRMPKELSSNEDYLKAVKRAYDRDFNVETGKQGVVGGVIDRVEKTIPGPSWRENVWPW